MEKASEVNLLADICKNIKADGKVTGAELTKLSTAFGVSKPSLSVKEEREPLVDVIPTDTEIQIIAELPGVEKENIKLHGTEDSLTISVDMPKRKYFKEVQMPAKIDPKKAKTTYKNGVLEITIPKIKEKKKPKGERIQIE